MFKKLLKYLFIALLFIVGELLFNICSTLISSSKPIQEVVHRAEVSLGFSILEKNVIIDSFYSTKPNYKISEPIQFKLTLKKSAFIYLMALSDKHSSLIFPNIEDKENNYKANKLYYLPSRNYTIASTKAEKIKFYLIASTTKLSLNDFNGLSENEITKKIETLESSNMVDIYRVDIEVK